VIRGVGVDLIEVARVRGALARWGSRFLERVYAPEELADARRGGDFAASLAARFAAKEAAYKALRQTLGRPLALRSIVVSAGRDRAPAIALEGVPAAGGRRLAWWCSLTHTADLACAVVVVEESAADVVPPAGG
jgi:holo-[acyl-carrier protein] synthase